MIYPYLIPQLRPLILSHSEQKICRSTSDELAQLRFGVLSGLGGGGCGVEATSAQEHTVSVCVVANQVCV